MVLVLVMSVLTIMTMMILMMILTMILMMIMMMILIISRIAILLLVLLLVVGPWSMHNSGGLRVHSVGGSRRQWRVGIFAMAKTDLVRA